MSPSFFDVSHGQPVAEYETRHCSYMYLGLSVLILGIVVIVCGWPAWSDAKRHHAAGQPLKCPRQAVISTAGGWAGPDAKRHHAAGWL